MALDSVFLHHPRSLPTVLRLVTFLLHSRTFPFPDTLPSYPSLIRVTSRVDCPLRPHLTLSVEEEPCSVADFCHCVGDTRGQSWAGVSPPTKWPSYHLELQFFSPLTCETGRIQLAEQAWRGYKAGEYTSDSQHTQQHVGRGFRAEVLVRHGQELGFPSQCIPWTSWLSVLCHPKRRYSNIFLDLLILSGAWLSPSLLSLIDECWDFVLSQDAHPQGTTRKVFVSLLVFAIDKCHL